MGNTCAQDCAALKSSQEAEAAFDANAEHSSLPAYAKVSVLASQAANVTVAVAKNTDAQDLPRIGLGAPLPSPKGSPVFGGGSSEEVSSPDDRREAPQVYVSQDKRVKPIEGMAEAVKQMQSASEPMRDLSPEPPIVESKPASRNETSLEMVFDVYGSERRVQILQRPLGAEFAQQGSSIKIERIRPQSHAAELGLQVGWSVKSIGGEDMTRRKFEDMQGALKSGMMALPMSSPPSNSGLELVFDVGGWEKRIQLNRRPLGAEFAKTKKDPTRIDNIRPQSYAAELGLQKGWIIKTIGGEDVTRMSFAQTQSTLQRAMSVLPMA